MILRQGTTVTIRFGPFVDATDQVTPENALAGGSPDIGVEVSKNHGAFAARNSATATTFDSDGFYTVELDTTDTATNGKLIVRSMDATTYMPVIMEFMVVPQAIFDAFITGTGLNGTGGISELSQAKPAAEPGIWSAFMLLYMAARNKLRVTDSIKEINNDAGTVICKKALSDDGTAFTEAEMESGP